MLNSLYGVGKQSQPRLCGEDESQIITPNQDTDVAKVFFPSQVNNRFTH